MLIAIGMLALAAIPAAGGGGDDAGVVTDSVLLGFVLVVFVLPLTVFGMLLATVVFAYHRLKLPPHSDRQA